MITEKAYAKLNLTLKITGRLGKYHTIESVMVPTDLCDTLTFEKRDDEEIVVEGVYFKKNSIEITAKLFQEKYHTGGVNIFVEKHIPIQGGMGGGSADSSATLRGLNRLFELNIPLSELEDIASQVGSDNVFCLYNKPAISYGKGNHLEFLDLDFKYNCIIIKPQFGCSTAEVYKAWRMPLIEENTWNMVAALRSGSYEELNKNSFNDLFVPAIQNNNELLHVKNVIESFNVKAFMTGSGSTFFAFDPDIEKLKEIERSLQADFFVYVTTIKNKV